jgi:hypothetical protein
MTTRPQDPDSEHTATPPRQPQLGDPDYNLAALHRDLLGGSLRWFASILTLLTTGFIIYQLCSTAEIEVFYPVHMRGSVLFWTSVGALLLWGGLALVNWVRWCRTKRL